MQSGLKVFLNGPQAGIYPVLRRWFRPLGCLQRVPMDFSHIKTVPKGEKNSLGWIVHWVEVELMTPQMTPQMDHLGVIWGVIYSHLTHCAIHPNELFSPFGIVLTWDKSIGTIWKHLSRHSARRKMGSIRGPDHFCNVPKAMFKWFSIVSNSSRRPYESITIPQDHWNTYTH